MYKVLLSNNRLSVTNHLMLGCRPTPAMVFELTAPKVGQAHAPPRQLEGCCLWQLQARLGAGLGKQVVISYSLAMESFTLLWASQDGRHWGVLFTGRVQQVVASCLLSRCRHCSCLPLLVTQYFVMNSAFLLDFGALLQFKQLHFLASCSNCSSLLNTSKRF